MTFYAGKAGSSAKFAKVMHEWGKGKLKSGGSKKKVKSQKQALAIAFSEERRAKRRRGASPVPPFMPGNAP